MNTNTADEFTVKYNKPQRHIYKQAKSREYINQFATGLMSVQCQLPQLPTLARTPPNTLLEIHYSLLAYRLNSTNREILNTGSKRLTRGEPTYQTNGRFAAVKSKSNKTQ